MYKALGQLTYNNPEVVELYYKHKSCQLFRDAEKYGYGKESGERPEIMKEIKFLICL